MRWGKGGMARRGEWKDRITEYERQAGKWGVFQQNKCGEEWEGGGQMRWKVMWKEEGGVLSGEDDGIKECEKVVEEWSSTKRGQTQWQAGDKRGQKRQPAPTSLNHGAPPQWLKRNINLNRILKLNSFDSRLKFFLSKHCLVCISSVCLFVCLTALDPDRLWVLDC